MGNDQSAGGHRRGNPDLSVVVVVYNIPREAPRTLLSLSADYQRHIDPDDYEVIVVDNGSNPPFDPQVIARLAGNFRLIRIDDASPSPAQAVNRGIAEARGEIIGVMIDGARIVTPGMLHFARRGARLHDSAVVATLGWYLGYDFQRWSMRYGYDPAHEDALLASIAWPQDGYRLFEIGTFDESSIEGWLQPISESNAMFLRREMWEALGGVDERFDLPGGGLLNLDTYRRAVELPGNEIVLLLGEATFHQFHGGIATNVSADQIQASFARWADQYATIRGKPYDCPRPKTLPTFIGTLPRPALARFVRAALYPPDHNMATLGPDFDRALWSPMPAVRPSDPTIATLVDMAQNQLRVGHPSVAAALARLIRERDPDEPEAQRLLSLLVAWLPREGPPFASCAYHYLHHLAIGDAYRVLGENDTAAANYRTALGLNPNLVQAHTGLATLRMPGDFYYTWLDRLYTSLAPESVIEIGVAEGASLACVRPPALAIGVDPTPKVLVPLKTQTHIFAETSDEFFARRRPDALLAGRPLGVGFIDGLHLYEQALKDFINLERYCGPRSVILLHDTVPLDESTQSRARDTQFHTGDVWKVVLCLQHYRPDLDVFTIPTPWTGLTVVAGLDSESRILSDRYDEAVRRFIDTPFSDIQDRLDDALNIVSNDWNAVEARLQARGIL
jgi:tetratricopeptide (TPR) repeat protein